MAIRKRLIVLLTALVVGVSAGTVFTPSAAMAVPSCGAATAYAAWSTQKAYNYAPGGWCIKTTWGQVSWQSDGNLVWYEINHYPWSRIFWATNTYGKGATRLSFQVDGNIVIYRGTTPLWAIGASSNRWSTTQFFWQVRSAAGTPCGMSGLHSLRHYQINPDINPLHLKTVC
jgi:hypothetical protein